MSTQMGRKFMVIAAISLMPEGSLLFDKAQGGSLDDAIAAAKAQQMSVTINNAQLLSQAEQRYLMTVPELPNIVLVTAYPARALSRDPTTAPPQKGSIAPMWMWSFFQATRWQNTITSTNPAAPALPPIPSLTPRITKKRVKRDDRPNPRAKTTAATTTEKRVA